MLVDDTPTTGTIPGAPSATPLDARRDADSRRRRVMTMVDRARTGDALAFDVLVAEHVDELHTFVAHRTGSVDLAEQVTVEVLTEALESMNEFRWEGVEYGPWLMGRAIARVRHHARGREEPLAPSGYLAPLATLGPPAVDCLLLRFVLGWSVHETAGALRRGSWGVRHLQLRALQTLDGSRPPGAWPVVRNEFALAHHADAFDTLLAVPRQGGRRASTPYEDLRDLVADLRETPAVDVPPDLVEVLRELMQDLAAEALVPTEAPAPEADIRPSLAPEAARAGRPPSRAASLGLLGGVAAVPLLALGVVTSTPGDVLHPVKSAVEQVQLGASRDPAERGQLQLEHASARLTELEKVLAGGGADKALDLVGEFEADVDRASGEIDQLPPAERDAAMQQVRWFAHDAMPRVRALEEGSPGVVGDRLAETSAALGELDARAVAACPGCTVTE